MRVKTYKEHFHFFHDWLKDNHQDIKHIDEIDELKVLDKYIGNEERFIRISVEANKQIKYELNLISG
ncbi:MAG TPA: hypothetical protein VNR61_01585 [Niallia sp.]|nr:hypothetical protein [Niallia sp.]